MALEPGLWALGLLTLPLLIAAGPLVADDIDRATQIEGLEARLEGLTRRVQALETLLKESGRGSASAPAPKGEPTWDLDDYSRSSPFQLIQRNLDRKNGRVDLLLDVIEPIPDLRDWATVPRGEPVPLQLTPDTGDAGASIPVALRLERATRFEPGARVHLSAQLEPSVAKRVRQIRVAHAPASGTGEDGGR